MGLNPIQAWIFFQALISFASIVTKMTITKICFKQWNIKSLNS